MSRKTTLLNCPIDLVDSENAINQVDEAILEGKNFHIITINPEMIMNAQKNSEFLEIINSSELNIIDGIGIKIALKLRGIPCVNVRGVDFARKLTAYANEKKLPIAFMGAKEEVINKACDNFLKEYPDLNIVFKQNGYFKNDEEVILKIKEANPRILLVGLGSPRQEEFILKLKKALNASVMIGVGGSFDVYSGFVKEAPLIYRKLGLEWLYRTVCQPERFKRIFPTLPIFLIKCIIETIVKRIKN
ncbi:MAG: WecB/TagA/CpsF family glycosyltransferase [Candidatus Gastranaerophilales bacterium]|nr:WecB/TagA/CpsF family glycosyltransferase [Candidatus Gastranaerophilales bacterium]